MNQRLQWEATPTDNWLFRLEGRTKLSLLILLAVFSVVIDSPRTLLALLWLGLFLHVCARISWERWQAIMIMLMLTMWGTMASQALFYNQEPRTEIACVIPPETPWLGTLTGGVYLYREGLAHGAEQAMRGGIMLLSGLFVCWTTDSRQLFRVLLQWKLPYEFVFMLITSLRFLPVVISETETVLMAQRLRGETPRRSLLPWKAVHLVFRTLLPVLARSMRRAETLALSVEGRGFGRNLPPAEMPPWPRLEKCFCLMGAIGLCIVLLVKVICFLHFNGLAYYPGLSNIYDFAQWWL